MINRAAPEASPRLALDDDEIALLDRFHPVRPASDAAASLFTYLTQIARLGGYFARARDPPIHHPATPSCGADGPASWISNSARHSPIRLVGNRKRQATLTPRHLRCAFRRRFHRSGRAAPRRK